MTTYGTITGRLDGALVLHGTIEARGQLTGTISLPERLHPEYEGPYEVYPHTAQQVLDTGGKTMSELQKIRIRLKAYDHALLDKSAAKIVETAKKTGADVSGPIPLPTEKEVVTIIRAVHKYKDSREQFEQRTHKRLIDITGATAKTREALTKLDMPAGIDIEIKL